MIRFLSALGVLALVPSAFAKPIDPLLSGDNLWAQKPDEFFAAAAQLDYKWTSATRDSLRVAGIELTAYGLPAVESIARFKDGKLAEITIMLYARGDAGELAKEKFDALVRTSAETLDKITKTKFTPRGKDPKNAVKADGLIWQTDQAHYLLEFSFTKEVRSRDIPFRAEFVRLEITPPDPDWGRVASVKSTSSTKFDGAAHVKRDTTSGDVWLGDVPMVDQQELAQAANSSAEGGTSSGAMLGVLKKLSTRLKVRVREVEKSDVKQILGLISDYNRAAKRADAAPLPEQGSMIDMGEIYRAMNVDVLREVRTKNKSDLTRFQRAVQSHIDEGTPLLWTVMLGKVPEPHIPQNAGGHMRLIIGYNPKTAEILFSDSWGAGHELKRMSTADAWTITTGATSIEPF
jgi:hypothetical protein